MIKYQQALYNGKIPVLFTRDRVDQKDVDSNLHMYQCRASDTAGISSSAKPVTIEKKVVVNFCGTIISKEDLFEDYLKTYEWFNGDKYIPLKGVGAQSLKITRKSITMEEYKNVCI